MSSKLDQRKRALSAQFMALEKRGALWIHEKRNSKGIKDKLKQEISKCNKALFGPEKKLDGSTSSTPYNENSTGFSFS